MPTQTIKQKRVMNILEALPPEKLDEVIDFAEYLKKKEPLQKAKRKHAFGNSGISSWPYRKRSNREE